MTTEESIDSKLTSTDDKEVEKDPDSSVGELPSTVDPYFSTKKSQFFIEAKAFLQAGDFEAALSKVEEGLKALLTAVPDADELHSSLGPLYYLYGTTLLYSIEESQDNPEESVMNQQAEDENDAGDLQIAWENLETARNILSKLTNCKGDQEEERLLDLAQIYCRLGDLSRHNGQYEQAISDYESSCEKRRSCLKGEKLWDRRIADVEYNLGITTLLFASEGEKNLLNDKEESDPTSKLPDALASIAAASGVGADEEKKINLSTEDITALREKSARHYVRCAQILGGMIACMSGSDPEEIGAIDVLFEKEQQKQCAKNKEESHPAPSIHEKASLSLGNIRQRVAKLEPREKDDQDKLHDLREMLDEIQETIDTCEKDREGLRDVSIMRKEAEKEIKKADSIVPQDKAESTDPHVATTTIGFGSSQNATSGGFSKSSGRDPLTKKEDENKTSVPMMVVKKKKRAPVKNLNSAGREEKRVRTE